MPASVTTNIVARKLIPEEGGVKGFDVKFDIHVLGISTFWELLEGLRFGKLICKVK